MLEQQVFMALHKDKKKEIVAKVKDAVGSAESVVFVNFHGVDMTDTTKLRKGLHEKSVHYLVAKKTLVRRALDSAGIKGETPALEGELALAYGDDQIAPAREIFAFQKKNKNKDGKGIAILGGIFEGGYLDKDAMMSIASIPPTEILYGQFVNIINSPIQRIVSVFAQIAEQKA